LEEQSAFPEVHLAVIWAAFYCFDSDVSFKPIRVASVFLLQSSESLSRGVEGVQLEHNLQLGESKNILIKAHNVSFYTLGVNIHHTLGTNPLYPRYHYTLYPRYHYTPYPRYQPTIP
jgi:hypothetical protein